ncbi:MAG: PFL family protein [Clostridia bacterium]|nr:PFL family protein [Clostridia bacterium]
MLTNYEILETIEMITHEHLDVRTVTVGISLLDCIGSTTEETAKKVYEKVTRRAEKLVPVCRKMEAEYGIPIVNKRVSVTPVSMIMNGKGEEGVIIAKALDRAAEELGIDFVGGYSALVHKGMSESEKAFINTIPEALSVTNKVCSSVNIGSTKAGLNVDAVKLCGEVIKRASEMTKDRESIACAKFVVFCNAVEDNPFMAGAFHGVGEGDSVINVGVSGPGVVKQALSRLGKDADFSEVAETIKKTAFKITRVGQLIAREASKRLGIEFGIVDLSLAPTPVIGDSVAHILEEMGLERVGGCGTTAALALLNDAVKKGGVMASSSVGGLSGAFIPVSEDIGMIDGVRSGSLTIEKLEAMTAVCSVGLDMIAISGDTSAETISALILDEAAIGMVNSKTTAVRVIPVCGKKAGDNVEFGGLLGRAPIIDLNQSSPKVFVERGGRIPAPMQSLKN